MPLLTPENLDPNSFRTYDYSATSNGRTYYREGRVTIASFENEKAICRVRSSDGTYTVTLLAESVRSVRASCDCGRTRITPICKHIIASALAVRDYIIQEAQNHWQYRLNQALERTPKARTARELTSQHAIIFGLLAETSGGLHTYRLVPYLVRSQDWEGMEELALLPTQAERNNYLDEDRSWVNTVRVVSGSIDHRTVVNLSLEGVQVFNLMLKSFSYYYGLTDFGSYLELLAKIDAAIFLTNSQNQVKDRLVFQSQPAKIEAALAHDGEDYSLQAGLTLAGKNFTTLKRSLEIITNNPAWALAGRTIVPVENPEALNLLGFFPMTIPAKDEQEFRQKYLQPILDRVPLQGNVVSWVDVDSEPVARLYLADAEGTLRASLRFGYGEYELKADPKAGQQSVSDIPDSWGMLRIHRRRAKEDAFYQLLTDARYGLKRTPAGEGVPTGTFELRARTHPLDFLLHSIPLLTQAGFEIYGQDTLKAGRINRFAPTISLNITSGLDWFDVKAVVSYGDQQVALGEIRHALRKQDRFIKLADGTIGQIPEEWLERYRKLFDMAEETEEGLRVRDFHLPLVDTLLEDADETSIAVEFAQRRQRLTGFEQIQAQPVPQGFTGELRPYQKAGLDWLHFLHQYDLGGCLADDMGLGKTIQVLALLQSLQEQGQRQGPCLLVVPKSLIANWRRESERFTPGLRFLEFVGIGRVKAETAFENFDVILTTYGTMLHDIEFLKGYTFDYAILDESQNIKNPLAQTSKAARLLNARHRLVMTGTPVENNTFELWSQFAFLNPGLLGSMDYFKREFASPIENRSKEELSGETATLLRRLVYPFILRRTKEQVAPELPERTERTLYTDMEPTQLKLYNHTRDYYRGLLVGMIDKEGINDVRMKILEGLLRLRQICIHPRLVEPGYKGESAKFELLLETLETLRAEGHKALVFSQFVKTLQMLRTELEARQVRYTYLDGQTNNRQEVVDTFQNDPAISFFLISLKAGGVGLNLTAADYVIHIDPWWNPAVEMQAADRAHRIGQDKPVFIYKIIARNTVEEKILTLQEHKKELVDQLISSEGSFFKSITKDDVKALFS